MSTNFSSSSSGADPVDDGTTDRRSFRRLDPELAPVELALIRWGEWVRREGGNRAPNARASRTLLHRIMTAGTAVRADPMAPEPPIPEGIAAVDAAVARLRRKLKDVIFVHYASALELPEAQARRLGVSPATLKIWLMIAREVVAFSLGLVPED